MGVKKFFKKIGRGFKAVAVTENSDFAAVEQRRKKLFGLQFHPEVTHTTYGIHILNNFLNVCEVQKQWNPAKRLTQLLQNLKRTVSDKKIFLFVSGGVDSLVAFALLQKVTSVKY